MCPGKRAAIGLLTRRTHRPAGTSVSALESKGERGPVEAKRLSSSHLTDCQRGSVHLGFIAPEMYVVAAQALSEILRGAARLGPE